MQMLVADFSGLVLRQDVLFKVLIAHSVRLVLGIEYFALAIGCHDSLRNMLFFIRELIANTA